MQVSDHQGYLKSYINRAICNEANLKYDGYVRALWLGGMSIDDIGNLIDAPKSQISYFINGQRMKTLEGYAIDLVTAYFGMTDIINKYLEPFPYADLTVKSPKNARDILDLFKLKNRLILSDEEKIGILKVSAECSFSLAHSNCLHGFDSEEKFLKIKSDDLEDSLDKYKELKTLVNEFDGKLNNRSFVVVAIDNTIFHIEVLKSKKKAVSDNSEGENQKKHFDEVIESIESNLSNIRELEEKDNRRSKENNKFIKRIMIMRSQFCLAECYLEAGYIHSIPPLINELINMKFLTGKEIFNDKRKKYIKTQLIENEVWSFNRAAMAKALGV